MQNRAKIFMPFDALGGLKEASKREELKHENKYVEVECIDKILKRFRIGDNVYISYYYNFVVKMIYLFIIYYIYIIIIYIDSKSIF